MSALTHRGLVADDARNAGPIAAFRPMDVSPADAQVLLEAAARRITTPALRDTLLKRAERVGQGALAPPPPLIRAPGEFVWKDLAYAAHPDLVALIRAADAELPQTCLCLLWGKPVLVHPATGVVFAVAIGSIGVAARLPGETGVEARFDLGRLGEGWIFVSPTAEPGWAGRAFAAAEN